MPKNRSAEAAFRSHLALCMKCLGYQSCKALLDLWLKPEIRPKDGVKYYSYLLCYIDDILCIHHNADCMFEWIGAKLCKSRLHNGVWAWAMSPAKYIY